MLTTIDYYEKRLEEQAVYIEWLEEDVRLFGPHYDEYSPSVAHSQGRARLYVQGIKDEALGTLAA
jgi:hypothetical protein